MTPFVPQRICDQTAHQWFYHPQTEETIGTAGNFQLVKDYCLTSLFYFERHYPSYMSTSRFFFDYVVDHLLMYLEALTWSVARAWLCCPWPEEVAVLSLAPRLQRVSSLNSRRISWCWVLPRYLVATSVSIFPVSA